MGDKAEFGLDAAGGVQRVPAMPEVRFNRDAAWTGRAGFPAAADTMTDLMADASRHRSVAAVSRDLGHEIKSVLNVLTLNLALLSRVASTGQPSRADLEPVHA